MIIQHNIMALNAYRQLNGNNLALARNLEKLSSGYRINRAGDDAAGLAISEKMRAQVKGLETATKNAQDGISLIQTAEGALTEVHSMLNRMVELATMAANGIYDDQVDRKALDDEFQQLKGEIDRISKSTNFNGKNLLDGTLAVSSKGVTVSAAANNRDILDLGKVQVAAVKAEYCIDTTIGGSAGTLTGVTDAAIIAKAFGISTDDYNISNTSGVITIEAKVAGADPNRNKIGAQFSLEAFEVVKGADAYMDTTITVGAKGTDTNLVGQTITVNGKTYEFIGDHDPLKGGAIPTGATGILENGNYAVVLSAYQGGTISEYVATQIAAAVNSVEHGGIFDDDGQLTAAVTPPSNAAVTVAGAKVTFNSANFSASGKATSGGLNLQIGDTGDKYNIISVSVDDMSAKGLRIDNLDIRTYETAVASVGTVAQQGEPGTIKGALNVVSAQRGALGALQNRLEHTINNLGVTTENVTAAESRIKDTDMAKEMMAYTKNNILVQAAQAMLAQANSVPQGVLQLLR